MSRPPRRRRLRQRLLDAVHEPDRAPARPGPRRGRRGLRRRPGEAPRGRRRGSTCTPDLPGRRRGLRAPGRRRRCSCSRACASTAGSPARRSRPASTCWSRSRWRRRWRRPSRCSPPPRPRPATCSAPRTSCSRPTYRAMHARVRGGRDRRAAHRARALRLGRPGLGPLVLRARRRRAVRPRRLQRHQPVRLLRPGAARDRDDRRRRSPSASIDGEPIARRAEDNAHVLLDFGDARFAVVTTGFTMQRYRSPAIELYGTHGVLQMLGDDWAPEGYELWRNDTAAWELHPESRPGVAVDGRPAPPRRVHRDRARPPVTRPEHAFHALEIMLAAQAAGADGRARDDHQRLPRAGRSSGSASAGAPRPPRARPAERGMSLVERPAAAGLLAAPDVRRPGADPPRRRHPPRVGRPRGGRGLRLDLRLDRARAHARLRPAAGRRLPPLGGLPHRLRRRRGAARARGHARHRRPRDRRGPARGDRRERVLPPRHVAPRVRARPRAAARARAVRAAARRGRLERLRARAALPRGLALRRRRAGSAPGRPRSRRPSGCASCAPATCSSGATSACCAGSWPAPSTSRSRRSRSARARWPPLHEHGGDEVLMALDGLAVGARLARRTPCTSSSSGRRTSATSRPAAGTSTATPAADTARAICGIAPSYLP